MLLLLLRRRWIVSLGLGQSELLGLSRGHGDSCGTLLVHLRLRIRLVLVLGLELAIALGLAVLGHPWPGSWRGSSYERDGTRASWVLGLLVSGASGGAGGVWWRSEEGRGRFLVL